MVISQRKRTRTERKKYYNIVIFYSATIAMGKVHVKSNQKGGKRERARKREIAIRVDLQRHKFLLVLFSTIFYRLSLMLGAQQLTLRGISIDQCVCVDGDDHSVIRYFEIISTYKLSQSKVMKTEEKKHPKWNICFKRAFHCSLQVVSGFMHKMCEKLILRSVKRTFTSSSSSNAVKPFHNCSHCPHQNIRRPNRKKQTKAHVIGFEPYCTLTLVH